MKYIKLFENKILDNILDKISDEGEKNLTTWEREYLASYSDVHKRNQMEEDIKKKDSANDKEVDVAELMGDVNSDSEFADDGDDESVKLPELEMHWNGIMDDDLNEFFDAFNVYGDYGNTPWENLPNDIKYRFQMYLKQKGYID